MLTCPLNIFFLLIIGAKVQSICLIDSGGGSVGRVDASSTRDPPSWAKFYQQNVQSNYRKDENKKEAGNGPS